MTALLFLRVGKVRHTWKLDLTGKEPTGCTGYLITFWPKVLSAHMQRALHRACRGLSVWWRQGARGRGAAHLVHADGRGKPKEARLPPAALAKHGAQQDALGSGSQLQPPLYQVTQAFDNSQPQVLRHSDIRALKILTHQPHQPKAFH